jgi:hypothetical protein
MNDLITVYYFSTLFLIYSPFLNFIAVFVLFALGADDVFVAVDKWKNARIDHRDASTEQIAIVALPDAAASMFQTSVRSQFSQFLVRLSLLLMSPNR